MSNQPTQKRSRWFRLEPTDAWFFRDGRPSNRGEDQSDIDSQFPPNAATVVGALRAALARESKHDWDGRSDWSDEIKQVLGDGNDPGQLSFTGPLLEKDGQVRFPMPGHVLGKTDEDTGRFVSSDWLAPSENPVPTDMGDVCLPQRMGLVRLEDGKKGPDPAEGFYVTTTGMDKILSGELPSSDECIHRDRLFARESRVGIQRDADSRTTGDGAIYSPRYIRLHQGVVLVVGISGLPEQGWDLPGYFPLGGESRLTSCEPIEQPGFPCQQTGDRESVLILATSARFNGVTWWGAGPGSDAGSPGQGISGNVRTATFERPLGIGGWD
jgi:CRISPR-associated protein Cmr3